MQMSYIDNVLHDGYSAQACCGFVQRCKCSLSFISNQLRFDANAKSSSEIDTSVVHGLELLFSSSFPLSCIYKLLF